MPRTKIRKQRKQDVATNNMPIRTQMEVHNGLVNKCKHSKDTTDNINKIMYTHIDTYVQQWKSRHLSKILMTTIGELRNSSKIMTSSTLISNATRSRNSSIDDGYLTADSNQGRVLRRSRSTVSVKKDTVKKRLSRSYSHQRNISSFRTPNASILTTGYGVITPKMKRNVPQVILRRPKVGEIAVSMSGSPLLVGNVAVEDAANINIPLKDGRLMSIQPQRGLRPSQLPEIDDHIRKQIETLRDNLNRVCSMTNKK